MCYFQRVMFISHENVSLSQILRLSAFTYCSNNCSSISLIVTKALSLFKMFESVSRALYQYVRKEHLKMVKLSTFMLQVECSNCQTVLTYTVCLYCRLFSYGHMVGRQCTTCTGVAEHHRRGELCPSLCNSHTFPRNSIWNTSYRPVQLYMSYWGERKTVNLFTKCYIDIE